jgi:hypothetical protein
MVVLVWGDALAEVETSFGLGLILLDFCYFMALALLDFGCFIAIVVVVSCHRIACLAMVVSCYRIVA